MAIIINDSNTTTPFQYIFDEDVLLNEVNTISIDESTTNAIIDITISVDSLDGVNGDFTITKPDNSVETGVTTISFSGTQAQINAALLTLQFSPNLNYNGSEILNLSVTSKVQQLDINGDPVFDINGDPVYDIIDTVNQDIDISITPINDDPVLTPTAPLSVAEGQANVAFSDAQFGLVDPDIATGQQEIQQQIVSILSIPTHGELRLNGNILQVGSVFSYDQLANLTYTHNGTDVSPGDTDFFTVKVDDGGGGVSAVTQIDINLTPVNKPPTVGGGIAILEGSVNNQIPVLINLGDNADTPATTTVNVVSVSNQGQGTLYLDLDNDGIVDSGEVLVAGSTFSGAQANLVKFNHNGNEPTITPPLFVVNVTDAGGGTGTPSTSANIPIVITVNPVDDDPTLGVNDPLTVTGASTTVITNSFLRVDDVDSENQNLVYSLNSRPAKGVLQLDIGGGNWVNLGVGALFTQQQINDGKIRYVHEVNNTNPTDTDSFSFVVRDSALRTVFPIPNEEGGIRTTFGQPLQVLTFNININNPNTATGGSPSNPTTGYEGSPVLDLGTTFTKDNSPQVPDEGGFNVITTQMLNYRFVNSGVAVIPDEQVVYTLKSLPDNIEPTGGLFKNGVKLAVDSTFTQKDINDGLITFVHNGSENFISSFNYSVSYGGEVRIDDTFSIDINPVNDTPTASGGSSVTLQEGTVKTLTTAEIILNDIDGVGSDKNTGFAAINTLEFQVTTLPTRGTLFIDGDSDGIVDSGEVITPGQWIAKQDLIDGKIKYRHDGTENFIDKFTIKARDNWGAESGTTDINIDIFPVNDAPQVPLTPNASDITISDPLAGEVGTTKNDPLTVNEGGSGTITNILLQAVDPDNNVIQRQYRITTKVANGTLFLNGKALGVGSTFTQKDIDDGKLTYKHNGAENFTDFFRFTVSDGVATTAIARFNINVNPLNDKPTLVTTTPTFNLDSTTALPITGIRVRDVDLTNVAAGETNLIRVTLDPRLIGSSVTYTEGILNLVNTTGITFVEGTNNTLGNKLVIEGTLASINAALASLTYQTSIDLNNTVNLNITVDDRLRDGSGNVIGANGGLLNQGTLGGTLPLSDANNTVTRVVKINVSTINDDPIITVPNAQTVNEDTPLSLAGITVIDSDVFDSDNNTVTVSVLNGTLSLTDTSLITGGANGSNTITLTGSFSAIDAALNGLSYQGNTNFNGSDTLTVTATDPGSVGGGGINTETKTVGITVTPVNDTPTLAVPGTQTINTNNPLVFTGISIDDLADLAPNNGTDNFTVTLTATRTDNNSLFGSLTAVNSGATITGSGASITIQGTKAQVNAALNGLSFTPSDYNTDVPINLAVSVNDNANGGTAIGGVGGAITVSNNIIINISDQNNAPSFSGLNNNPAYTENGSAIVLDNNATIIDPELSGLFNNWNGASLTLQRNGGANADDIFSTSGNLTFSGSNVIVGGTTIGTFTNTGGTLTFTFNNSATTALVNSALQQITYRNNSEDPNSSVTINYTINDGNPVINQGSGGALTGSGSITVNITPQPDAPVITPSVANPTYTENSLAVIVDSGLTLTDVDDTHMASATISISNNFRAGDVLAVTTAGTSITANYNAATGLLTLTGTDSKANYEQVLKSLTFLNNTEDPLNTTRTLTYSVTDANSDGAGTATGTATRNVLVTPINDAPTLTSTGTTTTYIEDAVAFSSLFSGSATGTIEAGQLINQLRFTVSNVTNGANEQVSINGTTVSLTNGATFTSGGFTGTVSLSGSNATVTINNATGATTAQINALVNGLGYKNTSQDPTAGNRVVTINSITDNGGTANGGVNNTNPNLVSTVNVIPVNDQPTLNATGVTNAPYNENASAVDLFSTITSSTVETGQTLSQLQLTVSNVSDGINEVLNIDGQSVTLTNGNSVSTTNGYTVNVSLTSGVATLTITKSGNATTAQINSLIDGISYRNNSESPTQGTRTITVTTLTDSGANGGANGDDNFNENVGRTATVVVNPINDAPVLDSTPVLSINTTEDVGVPVNGTQVGFLISDFVGGISDVDTGALTGIAITGKTGLGTLYYSTNNGTTWTSFNPSATSSRLLANNGQTRIFFNPSTDINGTIASGITFRAWDRTTGTNGGTANTTTNGGTTAFSTATDTISISITAVNDAPTRTSFTTTLASILEDNTNPPGATVNSLFNPNFTDATDNQTANSGSSANTLAGIAITSNGATAAQGVWQWFNTTNSTWTNIATNLTTSTALVLAENTLVRFLPSANYYGNPGSLTTRLIDNSSGAVTSGTTVNVTTSGGTTQYSNSSNNVILSTSVTSVNDAPSGTDNTVTTNEDIAYVFTAANFALTDPNDAIAPNSLNRVQITTLPTNGTLTNNGVAVTAGSFINLADITAGRLVFTPVSNQNGNNYANFTFQVEDNGGIANGGVNLDPTPNTININVNPINDAPTAIGTVSINNANEDTSPTGTVINTLITGANYSDVIDDQSTAIGNDNDTPLSNIAIVGSTNYVAGQGTWQYSNGSGGWINIPVSGLSDTSALIIPAGREIRFVPAANFFGTPGTLNVRLADSSSSPSASTSSVDLKNLNTNGSIGGTGTWSSGTVTINSNGITNINDAPTINNAGTPSTLANVNEDVTNPSGDTISNLFGTKYNDSIDNQSSILGGGNGTTPLAGIAITGNGANSATQGFWKYSVDNGTNWIEVPSTLSDNQALILPATAKLAFFPNANFNGIPGQLTVRLSDGTAFDDSSNNADLKNISSQLGGVNGWTANTTNLTTSVNAVNDAPIASGSTNLLPVNEDITNPTGSTVNTLFSGNFNDNTDNVSGGSTANNLAGVAIVGNVANPLTEGTWEYFNGTTWVSVGTRSASNALIVSSTNSLRFVPVADYNGPAAALTVHLIDSSITVTTGSTVNLSGVGATGGTTAYSVNTVNLTSNVIPINDAPTLVVPPLQTLSSGTNITFSQANGNQITIDDLKDLNNNGVDNFTVTLSVTDISNNNPYGSLTLANTSGLTVSGNGTATITLTGTKDDINNALNGLVYTPVNANAELAVNLNVLVNDLGNGSSTVGQNPLTVTNNIPINISNINEAPIVTNPITVTATEDTIFSFTNSNLISFNDPDDFGSDLEVTLSVTNGKLTFGTIPAGLSFTTGDGVNDKTFVFRGTESEINTALASLTYLGDPDYNTLGTSKDVLSITIDDLGNTGTIGGVIGVSNIVNRNIDISVTPVNDAPIAIPNVTIPGVAQDNTNPPANPLPTLLSGNYNDSKDQILGGSSSTPLRGIAIVGNNADPVQGKWQYSLSTLSVELWNDVPTSGLSASSALVLNNLASVKLRFLPNPSFNGTPTNQDLEVYLSDGLGFSSSANVNDRKNITADISNPFSGWSNSSIKIITSINTVTVNTPPIINNLEGDIFAVTPNGTTKIDQGTLATITDTQGLKTGGQLTISLDSFGVNNSGDQLSIPTGGNISVVGNVVSVNGTAIGTIDSINNGTNGKPLTINFTKDLTVAEGNALIQNITYQANATVGIREASFTVTDGQGGTSNTATAFLNVSNAPTNYGPAIEGDVNGQVRSDILKGTNGNDIINGKGSNDILYGYNGDDLMMGGDANDRLDASAGNDVLLGGGGDDALLGGNDQDILLGGDGNDNLNGGNGNDYLNGGFGADTLTGGLGNDMFDYSNLKNSFLGTVSTKREYDLIMDFNASQGDKILTNRAITSFNTSPATITSLTDTTVASALGSLGADSAALVKFGTRTFLAINDDISGFDATKDTFIEIRYTGTLDNSIFTTL